MRSCRHRDGCTCGQEQWRAVWCIAAACVQPCLGFFQPNHDSLPCCHLSSCVVLTSAAAAAAAAHCQEAGAVCGAARRSNRVSCAGLRSWCILVHHSCIEPPAVAYAAAVCVCPSSPSLRSCKQTPANNAHTPGSRDDYIMYVLHAKPTCVVHCLLPQGLDLPPEPWPGVE